MLEGLGVGQPVAIVGDIGIGAVDRRRQAVGLLPVILQLEVEFRLALAIDGGLERHVRILAGVGERAVLDFGLHPRNLGLQGRNLGDQCPHIRGGEGRIEARQHLTGVDHVAGVHIDRPHNGCVQRLNDDRGRARDHDAGRGDNAIHLDHSRDDAHCDDEAAERESEAARNARHRHVDDCGGGRLVFQDDRQGWVHPVLHRRTNRLGGGSGQELHGDLGLRCACDDSAGSTACGRLHTAPAGRNEGRCPSVCLFRAP